MRRIFRSTLAIDDIRLTIITQERRTTSDRHYSARIVQLNHSLRPRAARIELVRCEIDRFVAERFVMKLPRAWGALSGRAHRSQCRALVVWEDVAPDAKISLS